MSLIKGRPYKEKKKKRKKGRQNTKEKKLSNMAYITQKN